MNVATNGVGDPLAAGSIVASRTAEPDVAALGPAATVTSVASFAAPAAAIGVTVYQDSTTPGYSRAEQIGRTAVGSLVGGPFGTAAGALIGGYAGLVASDAIDTVIWGNE